ncbi:putative thiopeptide-lantipeptide biosynthesis related protein [Streptomyces glaucescens]|uniref:Putative thiopeptide-lantipeptide biosynthesis related protein n=1 Tax=Streptomyces glaucescens TaxID=1907 RepID=A0A089WZI8_STRGA|nr:putative thiopeptide-lantipeptide biosynthesis related protein [Streptomyces glaucescens]
MLLAGTLAGSALAAVTSTASAAPNTAAAAVVPSGPGMELSAASFTQMTVDDVGRRVWIAGDRVYPDGSRDGELVGVLYGGAGPAVASAHMTAPLSGVAVEPDGSKVYAGQSDHIANYSHENGFLYPLAPIPAPADGCGRELVHTGGRLFFTSRPAASPEACADGLGSVGVAGTAQGGTAGEVMYSSTPVHLEGGPGGLLVTAPERSSPSADPDLGIYRVTDGTDGNVLEFLGERRFTEDGSERGMDFRDADFSADGSVLAVADGDRGTVLLASQDARFLENPYEPLPAGVTPTAVAFSPDGKWFAQGGAASGDAADLTLAFADPSVEWQPLRISFEDEAAGHRVVPRGMEFSGDGQQLFVVTSDQEGTRFWLHTIQTREALAPSRFVDVTHGPAVAGEPFRITGRLDLDGPAPTEAPRITVLRLNGQEVADLPPVPVAEDGTFAVEDVLPDRAGDVHYVLGYAGDEVHYRSEHWLVVDTVRAPDTVSRGGR